MVSGGRVRVAVVQYDTTIRVSRGVSYNCFGVYYSGQASRAPHSRCLVVTAERAVALGTSARNRMYVLMRCGARTQGDVPKQQTQVMLDLLLL